MFDSRGYRELTVAAVLLGIVQGVILNIAFVYIALKLGFSLGGSAIAAILGYALLRGVLRKGTIVENNINQTIASGINSGGVGVVFVLPALFLLNANMQDSLTLPLWSLLLAGIGGAILGVVVIIPLRKQLIELERLRFPTGVAVATIIHSGAAGIDKAKLLGIGFLISVAWKLVITLGWLDSPGLLEGEELNLSFGLLPAYMAPALYLSLMNFAAGLLSGRAGLPFFFGGILAWWVISPASVFAGWTPLEMNGQALADFIYAGMLRPLGIGILIGAAFMELIVNFPAVKSAFVSLASVTRNAKNHGMIDRDEMPLWVLLAGGGGAIVFFFLATWSSSDVSLTAAMLVAVLSTLWLGLAGLIVTQCTGLTDISPISGIALVSVTMLMIALNGNLAATLIVTLAVAVGIGQSADMMQDLKTGFMVGSRQLVQQLVQFSVSWIGVIIAFGVLYVLWGSGPGGQNGFGPDTALPAPQATALTSIIEAVQSNTVPTDKFVLGGIVGMLLGAAPIAGLGILMGLAMYLPFSITFGYGLGCLTQMIIHKRKGEAFTENKIVPLAAGLIIGEALMGVGYAIYQILQTGGG